MSESRPLTPDEEREMDAYVSSQSKRGSQLGNAYIAQGQKTRQEAIERHTIQIRHMT